MGKVSNGYSLYFNKNTLELVIEPNKTIGTSDNEIILFNDCHYMCNDRKKLRDKAKEIKQEWLNETIERLDKINNLKVKNKY